MRHLVRRDRCGEALELERPELGEPERLPPREQPDDDAAREDLPGLRLLTQPARDHHRGAEVVRLLAQRLAGVQPEPLPGCAAARRLLHRHGGAHGVGGRGEHGHQPVTEPFHLLAAVRRDGVLEQAVVGLEDALRPLVADALEQLGGVDEIGEQERDGRAH